MKKMATEQEIREENKNLNAQVNSLVEDLHREREEKAKAKKHVYDTLEKYAGALRIVERILSKTHQQFFEYIKNEQDLFLRSNNAQQLIQIVKEQNPDTDGLSDEDIANTIFSGMHKDAQMIEAQNRLVLQTIRKFLSENTSSEDLKDDKTEALWDEMLEIQKDKKAVTSSSSIADLFKKPERGRVLCISCEGRGKMTCSTCGGFAVTDCSACKGNAEINGKDCMACKGIGGFKCSHCDGWGTVPCPLCKGADKKTE